MAIKLHRAGFDNAVKLIKAHEFETFPDWDEEKPTQTEIDEFMRSHYMKEYGLWFLGTDDKYSAEVKEHYVYPHGDLKEVQLCALEDSLENAEKSGHEDIMNAAQELLDMITDLE